MSESHRATAGSLERERRLAPLAVGAAVVGAVSTAGALIAIVVADLSRAESDHLRLLNYHAARTEILVSTAFQALAIIGLAGAVAYLLAAAAARTPSVPRWALWLLVLATLLLVVGTVWRQLAVLDVARDFAQGSPTRGAAGERRAEELIKGISKLPLALALVGTLLTAASIVFASVTAMRAGLVSRFVGFVGVFVGALHVIPLGGGPQILQVFWLAALALLFADRWPGGRGPAWASGRAEPWPPPATAR